MIRSIPPLLAIAVGLALASTAAAAPRKVLVLPLGGDADPELRARYSASVQRLARTIDGQVTPGDVTFTDTATAIGCDPKTPKCAEDVRATLGVDELVYGTVTKEDGKLVLVVRRTAKGKQRREITTTLEATDPPERAEPEMLPLFRDTTEGSPGDGGTGGTGGGTGAGSGSDTVTVTDDPPNGTPEQPEPRAPLSRTKLLGYGAVGGGTVLLLISFGLWSSASSLQGDIDGHPVEDYDDFADLTNLEDRARVRAWTGNALFLTGLAAGGLGAWILYKERKAQHTVVTPAPTPGGAAIMLGGVF